MQAMPSPASVAPFNASMLLQVSIERICGAALPVMNGQWSSLPLLRKRKWMPKCAERSAGVRSVPWRIGAGAGRRSCAGVPGRLTPPAKAGHPASAPDALLDASAFN